MAYLCFDHVLTSTHTYFMQHTVPCSVFSICVITIGEYLWEKIQDSADFEVAFVWNRSTGRMQGKVPDKQVLVNLEDFAERHVV